MMAPEVSLALLSLAPMMQALRESEPWLALVKHLREDEAQLVEQLLNAPAADHDVLRGSIAGLRRALDYPERIIRTAEILRQQS